MTSAAAIPVAPQFAERVMAWQSKFGRNNLPWQKDNDPYRVWLSEIMLQQTQVTTVIDYYQRFLQRFPSLSHLAAAPQEEVMRYWSGLGYYARGRNLHACAQQIQRQYGGMFPSNYEALLTLPGIGKSTAAAIAAFCFEVPISILDGNVKRVLCRYFALNSAPSAAFDKELWQLAQTLLPTTQGRADHPMRRYTQGLMDLGATCCTRAKPRCMACPLAKDCQAFAQQNPEVYPQRKATKALPQKDFVLLLLLTSKADKPLDTPQDTPQTSVSYVVLQARPNRGLWGGLWSLPELELAQHPQLAPLLAELPTMPTSSTRYELINHTTQIYQSIRQDNPVKTLLHGFLQQLPALKVFLLGMLDQHMSEDLAWCTPQYIWQLPRFQHRFTHFVGQYQPVLVHMLTPPTSHSFHATQGTQSAQTNGAFTLSPLADNAQALAPLALPKPIKKLLSELSQVLNKNS